MTVVVSTHAADHDLIDNHAARWRASNIVQRLWRKDPTVWADPPVGEIANRLGWLDAPFESANLTAPIAQLAAQAVSDNISNIVLIGMGGSSLAPEVLANTLDTATSPPRLVVIDSTHPLAIENVATTTDPDSTWYLIASKSGGTVETLSLFRFFWRQVSAALNNPGRHFIAITDKNSGLASLAAERGFREIFLANPDVGGRYSALTAFGLVPTGLTGGDLGKLLAAAQRGAGACGPDVRLEENPGFTLGVVMAGHALKGTDKTQFLATGPTRTIGVWIEQLIAESTGKNGVGIVPIDGGSLLPGSSHATVVTIGSDGNTTSDVAITIDDPHDIAELMFIFEFATAVAGEILDVNPFDQPDVESAKNLTRVAMEAGTPAGSTTSAEIGNRDWVGGIDSRAEAGTISYIAVQAYLHDSEPNRILLTELADALSERLGVYVTLGIGPRFLHSTGQLHKGGPPGGVYLQITDDTGEGLAIPESDYSFNELIAAQSIGDRTALELADRTVITVALGSDSAGGLLLMIEQVER